ncbi:PDZ domain-containing protein [Iamia majanohamensis]|uniref:PDZ domain-containing protein n=1 Tax=Iamia majanohamensis TaxID=467976 RepID=A0AAE9YGV6_9ACTN|nr:trypsin-like peptidase domain-containing protein [Iamia majanohamensis]WCO67541.1 PDZ domain-containing protein [Iamia majanohamensis]
MPDEPDDWSDPTPPLPPDDRLWRHPSEVARAARSTPPPAPARPRRGRRRLVAVAVLSGLTGAAATVVALAAVGSLSPRTIERVEQARAAPTVATTASVRTASSVAASIAPAVVEVTATVGEVRRSGSGVVVREDGLILTSGALVAGADALVVTWPSGRSTTATDEGHDDVTGLAALTVEGSGHPVAQVGAAAPLPGETAITVAGSSDSGPMVTQGVVSATGSHADPEEGRLLGMIETDQPVPDRADGAALVDGDGHLLGVCLSVADQATSGFAVPAEVAERVADDLRRSGHVDRGWLGVSGAPSDPTDAGPAGLEVAQVAPGSPAEEAGLEPGDVVTSVAGQRVSSVADVQAALGLTRPEQEISLRRARDEQVAEVDVVLAAAPG